MKYTTLLHIDPSKVSAPNQKIEFILKYTMLLHIGPSQVSASNQENAVDHETFALLCLLCCAS